jgi:hypothetical protein
MPRDNPRTIPKREHPAVSGKLMGQGAEEALPKIPEILHVGAPDLAEQQTFQPGNPLTIIRADLRITTAAITANDLPKAKAHFATFKSNVPKALPLIKARSTTAADDTSAALAAADAKFTANGTIDDVKPLVAALTSRYNFGVALVNAAARNADSKKTTYTPEDVTTLTALNDIMIQVNRSMTEYTAGDFAKSGSDAALAAGDSFAKVQPILAAKNGSDVALKTALGAYAALAGAAGDTAKVKAANRTAYEAVFVAQQVIVGQFWADSKLQSVLSALPKS